MRGTKACLGVLLGLVLGCASGHIVKLNGSPQVPAAQGAVRVASGANHNTRLRIDVHHLAEPQRIAAGATSLVAWAQPSAAGGAPQNIGALRVNDKLEGELETVTPQRDFELMITAEPSPTAPVPSGAPLLSAHISTP
ncbi:MAG: hypothetical protein U1A78_30105 [Polyangia bacterium]